MKTLSVIVVNKNRGFAIEWCLKSILPQLRECDRLIVIDDNSDDGSEQILASYSEHFASFIHFDSHGNRSKVRNRAAREATGDILVFIDGDVIIDSTTLERVRQIHEDDTIVGLNGAVYGNSHTVEQVELITHRSIEELNALAAESFDNLAQFLELCDYRSRYTECTADEYRNWSNYFTSFATAVRSAYEEIGGFEEGFTKWGVEDMEFAYRLNKKGRIVFAPDIVSYHHPHEKNAFNNALSNMQNLYTMLDKYRSTELEAICAVTLQAGPAFVQCLQQMFGYMAQYNTYEPIELKEREIAFYFPTKEHENGYIEYMLDGKLQSMELFGMAVPFVNDTFDRVYFSAGYSLMQIAALAITMQEALRIGKQLLIPRRINKDVPCFCLDMFVGGSTILFGEMCGVVQSLTWFDRFDFDEDYYEIKWKENSALHLSKQILEI